MTEELFRNAELQAFLRNVESESGLITGFQGDSCIRDNDIETRTKNILFTF